MTKKANLETASPLVIFYKVVLVQDTGCSVHQIHPASLQQGVCASVIMGDTIEGWVAEHPHIQVGVAKPVHSILTATCAHTKLH